MLLSYWMYNAHVCVAYATVYINKIHMLRIIYFIRPQKIGQLVYGTSFNVELIK